VKAWLPHVEVVRVVDGDTFRAHLDLGEGVWIRNVEKTSVGSFRIAGIQAPEARAAGGAAATAQLRELLPVGVYLPALLYAPHWKDDFGRVLADVVLAYDLLPDGPTVAGVMVATGHAKEWWP
jgi:endonuclease YncB( thermonuclease family)